MTEDHEGQPSELRTKLALGEALAFAWKARREWIHRKVDSARLQEEHRGRRRVSLDLTVPDDPGLSYAPQDRAVELEDGQSPLVVPIALMAKKTLRDFDVSLEGKPLPVLTSRENGEASTATVLSQFTRASDEGALEHLWEGLHPVVVSERKTALEVEAEKGQDPSPALEGEEEQDTSPAGAVLKVHEREGITVFGETLLRSLEDSFLLMVLVPREKAGQRIVVKFSYHWDRVLPKRNRDRPLRSLVGELRSGWRPATGRETMKLEVDLDGPDDAQSYHLEFHAPPSLVFTDMILPGATGRDFGPAGGDPDMQVIQGHHRYETRVTEPATLFVAGTNSGMRMVALVVTLYTAVAFLGSLMLPGAFPEWVSKGSQVTSLLMAVPAAAVAALNRPQENSLASYFWRPLRLLVMACASLLMCGAAALAVGWRYRPIYYAQWLLTGFGAFWAFLVIFLGCRAKIQDQAPGER